MKTEAEFKKFKDELDELLDKYDVRLVMAANNKQSDWSHIVDERLSVVSWSTKKEFRLT